MVETARIEVGPIGWVSSALTELEQAPRQGDEGAPGAIIAIRPELREGLSGLRVGDRLVLLTWLHHGDRTTLSVHPRDDVRRLPAGVFATRSADRPNPIGLHEVELLDIEGTDLRVGPLEAIDGTPVLDIKPVLRDVGER
jgi:tRNA-Thr(GGU) m(6)t(6)A37 methyltransferase TsaA